MIGIDPAPRLFRFAATRHLENAHIVQADIYRLPLKRAFDTHFQSVCCITCLIRGGFRSLASKVKPADIFPPGSWR